MSGSSQVYQWQPESQPRSSLSLWARLMLLLAFLLFVTGGLLFGYLFYSNVTQRMAQPLNPVQSSVAVPSSSIPSSEPVHSVADPAAAPTQAPSTSSFANRVNILLLGIDQREQEAGLPTRTDTMILLTIDPASKSMGMLTIPRDLWVPIPGLGRPVEDRINSANLLGDLEKYPGGGPALAKKTVQYNLGVPVNYYVRLDFKGFEKIVDALGGVTINVPQAIQDDEYPDDNYGVMSISFPAGVQHMDGETALRYVRTRHADSDFGRGRRQILFLMAMRDQALKLNILPKLPTLISQMRDSVKTDLSANDIINLARIAGGIDTANITARNIDESMATRWITPQGGDVMVPKRDAIKKVVDEVFSSPGTPATPVTVGQAPTPTPTVNTAARSQMQSEAARIEVLNGTNTKGLATRAANNLTSQGLDVVKVGDAGRYDYIDSVIVYYANKPLSQSYLAQLFKVPPENIRPASTTNKDVDIRVILGANATVP
jgi:polyisoprenyl-teichoic acid--peptidoglycan teichoic acid transferase